MGRLGQTAAGRGIVNLTQAYREGSAHVEQGAIAVGNGVQWKPEMEGWFISFDADTTELSAGPTRQWYRVREVLSPTKLRLFGYTYFSVSLYKGKAIKNGPYLLCPYTEMADGDALTNQGMRVIPLQSAWKKGDQIETVAGIPPSASAGGRCRASSCPRTTWRGWESCMAARSRPTRGRS